MRALTLTQPWAGLVAANIKRVENRPRHMIKRDAIGKRFAIHASREIDEPTYERIGEIAPELQRHPDERGTPWYALSRITSAIIAVATLDKILHGWDEGAIRDHANTISFSDGRPLGPEQIRWFFGPIGYVLRDVVALAAPVPCRGWQGFWTLPDNIEHDLVEQLELLQP
jgi:hypothetical protein